MKTHTENQWYEANMGNDTQGLIIDSEDGRNVAVSYNKTDAPLIAAAPDLLRACHLAAVRLEGGSDEERAFNRNVARACRDAIRLAEGGAQ
jgi:hypothetical protein